MSWKGKVGLVLVIWLTAVSRTRALFINDFHADEALFASFARHIAVWRDPLLLTQSVVDKPPLLFYLQALFYPMQGPVEWAARLPNYIASILLVPLVGMLVWRLVRREETAVFAATLVALSPLHIQFSASAFTDPLLTTFLFASVALLQLEGRARVRGGLEDGARRELEDGARARGKKQRSQKVAKPPRLRASALKSFCLSGTFFGLAILTKHQAWLFLPLLLILGVLQNWRREWLAWLRGFLPLLLLGWGWELVRNGRLTLIANQVDNVGGFDLVAWSELGARLIEMGKIGQYVISPFVVGVLVLVFLTQRLKGTKVGKERKEKEKDNAETRRRGERKDYSPHNQQQTVKRKTSSKNHHGTRNTEHALPHVSRFTFRALSLFILAYLLFHLIIDIPVWDRYFLPLVPLTAVLLATLFNKTVAPHVSRFTANHTIWRYVLYFIIIFPLLPPAWEATNGRFPIGARPFADSGAEVVAEALANEPYGTVLYDHWYSWHWQYHLFDKKVHLNWFPDTAVLLEDLTGFYDDQYPRYIALPNDERGQPVEQAIQNAGFSLEPMPIIGKSDIILYRILRRSE